MIPEVAASHFSIVLAIGATGYVGLVHFLFWSWGRGEIAHLWASLFCVSSLVFLLARYAQISTIDAAAAVASARIQTAVTPLLVLCLVGFARTLREDRSGRRYVTPVLVVAGAALASICLFSDWIVPDATTTRADWMGGDYISVPLGAGLAFLIPWMLGGLYYFGDRVARSKLLQPSERRVLLSCLCIHVLLALASAASTTTGSHMLPIFAHYSPLVVAIGISYVLLHRDRRLQIQLEETVGTRTRELGDIEARYRTLVDNSPLGVIACDRMGDVIAANPRLLEILGIRSSAGGPPPFNLFEHPGIIELGLERKLRNCLETGEPSTEEVTYAIKAGKRLELRVKIAAVRGTKNAIVGAQAITEDIEDEKQLEEKLRQSQKMEAIGRLAAGIAHEINNPMAYVRSNLGMLQREWGDLLREGAAGERGSSLYARLEEHAELVEEAIDGVERTISIVRDVKEFSHTSGDGHVLADLNEIAEDALRIAAPQLNSAISIERIYGRLPKLPCSPGQIQQVFLNLVVNAAQAVEAEGTIWIITRMRDDQILIRVEDDGCGMSDDTLQRLFDPFFTTKAAGQGTGLGLYISYEIVRMHGGDIQVMSTPGEGSAFEVNLPLHQDGSRPGSGGDDRSGSGMR